MKNTTITQNIMFGSLSERERERGEILKNHNLKRLASRPLHIRNNKNNSKLT